MSNQKSSMNAYNGQLPLFKNLARLHEVVCHENDGSVGQDRDENQSTQNTSERCACRPRSTHDTPRGARTWSPMRKHQKLQNANHTVEHVVSNLWKIFLARSMTSTITASPRLVRTMAETPCAASVTLSTATPTFVPSLKPSPVAPSEPPMILQQLKEIMSSCPVQHMLHYLILHIEEHFVEDPQCRE